MLIFFSLTKTREDFEYVREPVLQKAIYEDCAGDFGRASAFDKRAPVMDAYREVEALL